MLPQFENLQSSYNSFDILRQAFEETAKTKSINEFRIVRHLGAGSYGKVYEAEKKSTKETYALKSLKEEGRVIYCNNLFKN